MENGESGFVMHMNSMSRDELQAVIAAVRAHEFTVSIQFVNFRDRIGVDIRLRQSEEVLYL
jgi:hypothetical protein